MTPLTRRRFLGAAAGAALGRGRRTAAVRPAGHGGRPRGRLPRRRQARGRSSCRRTAPSTTTTAPCPGCAASATRSLAALPEQLRRLPADQDRARRGGAVLQPWHLDTATTDAQRVSDLDHSWSGTHCGVEQRPVQQLDPGQDRQDHGLLQPRRHPVPVRARRRVHHLRPVLLLGAGPDQPEPALPVDRHDRPERHGGRPGHRQQRDRLLLDHLPRAAAERRRLLAGLPAGGQLRRQPAGLVHPVPEGAHHLRRSTQRAWRGSAASPSAIAADIAAGTFPAVSWVVAPTAQCEHPAYPPAYGADYVAGRAERDRRRPGDLGLRPSCSSTSTRTTASSTTWRRRCRRPAPPTSSSAASRSASGPRVPMTVISPWSGGGRVCSQIFDHTSVLRFVETWTGVAEPHISAWRRTVCGDLTSAFNFAVQHRVPDAAGTAAAGGRRQRAGQPAGRRSAPTSVDPAAAGERRPAGAAARLPLRHHLVDGHRRPTGSGSTVTNHGSLGGGFARLHRQPPHLRRLAVHAAGRAARSPTTSAR